MTNLPDVRPASATGPELRERTLELLEFPRIREALASHTRTPMSRERALALTPVHDTAAVAELQQETAEAALLLEESPSLALAHDPRPLIHRAAVGSSLSGGELIAVADGLEAVRSAKALGGAARTRTPLLRSLTRNIADLRPLERELRAKLTPAGELRDDASPLLRQLRTESRNAYHQAAVGLQAYIDSDLGAEVLQDRLYTVRGGRLVLPVKADFKGRMPGVVHGSSDSGATLFIEPFSNVHRTNRWREAGDAEQDEVRRILQRLTLSVARRAAETMYALEMVGRLDAALAKARYAQTYRGVGVGEGGSVQLIEARHPLLETAVPVSLALQPPVVVLVVTGPNTGGKTVALKTLGLMALMRQSGLLLPCSPQTTLPLFDGVYADIGDQQSIEHAVSTFSSHVTAIAGILAHATPRSLVLFDELGTSTDPEEGAALGYAVAAHLAEQGVPCVVTTHHRPLAALAEEHEAMENASVELDPQTLRPTYKLTMGLPGRSYAMDIAARTGLDARIIEAAQQRLGPVHRETEGLLTAIRWERALTREKLDEAEAERARAAQLSTELAKEVEALESAQASVVEEVRAELRQEANRVRARLRQAESAAEWQTFRGEPPPPRVTEAASADVADVQRALRSRVWGKRAISTPAERRTKLTVGETVEVGALGIKGSVLTEPDNAGRVEVLVGSARLQMDVSRLRRAGEPVEEERARLQTRSSVAIPLSTPAPGIELDVRGERANEAVERLDAYLDSAVAYGLAHVRIVHGKGTGALRNAVWRRLADSSAVASYAFAPRERGGDGATEVELR